MAALNIALPFLLILRGQIHISTGLVSIVKATTAIMGAVVAGIVLSAEPLTVNKLSGALTALLGVVLIMVHLPRQN